VPCSDAEPCPGGFDCRDDTACWPSEDDGGGCSVGRGARGPAGAALWLLAVLALASRRRSHVRSR
jgi:MYXO-CTERM domain-containing protein